MSEIKPRVLDAPMLSFAIAEEIERLKEGAQWATAHRNAVTLVKTAQLRVVLVMLKKGASLREHHVEGPISLLVLSGAVRFTADGEDRMLSANSLLTLNKTIPHDVEALEESAFLLTIVQPPGTERPH